MIVGAGATYSQKNGVEGNGGSLKDGAEAFVLFLRGAQLVLRPSVLTELDLNEVDVSMLSLLGRCCLGKVDLLMAGSAVEVLPVISPFCPLPLQSIHPPPLLEVYCFFDSWRWEQPVLHLDG